MAQPDRRVRRTRDMLKQAFMELLEEKDYDSISVLDVVERANVGRATFYLHFTGKDDLFLHSHTMGMTHFKYDPFSREELLADTAPQNMIDLAKYLSNNRPLYFTFKRSKEAAVFIEQIRRLIADNLEASLNAAFNEADSEIPFNLLANYIAGAQLACKMWWADNHTAYSPEYLANVLHRLQRAAIRDALNLKPGEG
jgi:AcrR family transcriptional regulator